MIYLLPQLPVKNRYSEDWIGMWRRELKKLKVSFRVVGNETPVKLTKFFSNPLKALEYEANQIKELAKRVPDKIFCLDIDFPGLLVPAIQVLRLANPKLKCYGYLHAGSWNKGDIFAKTKGKKGLERAMFDVFDKIFVATHYHKKKIETYFGESFANVVVVGLPFYREDVYRYVKPLPFNQKEYILINGRPEQSDMSVVESLKKSFPFEKFVMGSARNRKEYYTLLNKAKISISLKTEETFGLGQVEAFALGTIPLSPKAYGYVEIFSNEYMLYRDIMQLFTRLNYWLISEQSIKRSIDFIKYENSIAKMVRYL